MGQIFSLDDATKTVISAALDDLLVAGDGGPDGTQNGGLGKTCRLVYPPLWVPCGNCVWDSVNQKSGNTWKHGGPMQFPQGQQCPICGGKGQRAEETTEDVVLGCTFDPKKFWYPVPSLNIRVPDSLLQTKGFFADLPKVDRCDHMIFQIKAAGLIKKRFKLIDSPGDVGNIIQGRYFHCTWKQIV